MDVLRRAYSNIKNHKIVSVSVLCMVFLSSFTDVVEKAFFWVDAANSFTKPEGAVEDLELSHLVGKIQATHGLNKKGGLEGEERKEAYLALKSEIYPALERYLRSRSHDVELINEPKRWNEELYAQHVGDVTFISTMNQYKTDGFILFVSRKDGRILLSDKEFMTGIRGVKVISKTGSTPDSIVMVKYMTITGTGTYGESVKFFTIDEDLVLLSLDKPYKEDNVGWGAFQTPGVSFVTRNDVIVKNGVMEVHTTGYVSMFGYEGEDEKSVELPKEVYSWNAKTRQFDQIQGRMTHMSDLMTHVYSDLANPDGDWYRNKKPVSLGDDGEKVFQEETW